MSGREIVELASGELKKLGIHAKMKASEATWTNPGLIEFEADGVSGVLPYVADYRRDYAAKMAECVFDDVLRALGRELHIPDRR